MRLDYFGKKNETVHRVRSKKGRLSKKIDTFHFYNHSFILATSLYTYFALKESQKRGDPKLEKGIDLTVF